MTVLGPHDFKRMVPHRYPMLLIDRIIELVPGERARGLKAITLNEPWYANVPDDAPAEDYHYPWTVLTESWGHVAGMLVGWGNPNPDARAGRAMLLGGMAEVEFHRPAVPGDVVEHRVRVARVVGDTYIFEGESVIGDEPVMTIGRMVTAMRPAAELTGAAPDGQAK